MGNVVENIHIPFVFSRRESLGGNQKYRITSTHDIHLPPSSPLRKLGGEVSTNMRLILATALLSLSTTAVLAQTPATPPTPGPGPEVQRNYNALKGNILKSADKMPEDLYSYKPTADIRTFARILTHVIEAQVATCGAVNGTAQADQAKTPAETAPKAEIVAALKASFDACDKAYASVTDANAIELLNVGQGRKRTRIGMLWGNVSHDNEQYAQLATYMRLKNITPPSASEK